MPLGRWWHRAHEIPGAPGIRGLLVDQGAWREVAQDMAAIGGRLLAMWGEQDADGQRAVRVLLLSEAGALLVRLSHSEGNGG